MSLSLVLAAASLLCGVAVGLAVNRLLAERIAEQALASTAGLADETPASMAELPLPAPLSLGARLANPVLLGAVSLVLSRLPGLREPVALSQALLLLYLLYPLAVVDFATLTIEPALVVGGIVLRGASVLGLQRGATTEMLGGMLAGAGLLALIGFAYQWLRGREGLGEGDPAVLGLIGAFVGWSGLLPVVLLGTATGLLAGVPLLLLTRRPLNTPLPFAPSLCVGGFVVFLLQAQGWSLFGLLPGLR
ncbi:MAG TPA: A24 family peptidase [bacterium]|nr:A24 family peptidase [bacterium]